MPTYRADVAQLSQGTASARHNSWLGMMHQLVAEHAVIGLRARGAGAIEKRASSGMWMVSVDGR